MAASACPLRFQPVSLAGGRLRAAHRRAAVVARQPPSRSMTGLLFLRGVGSLRAFVLSSSNVPGWVVSQPGWLGSGVVAFRRRFKTPRAYRPAPRKRGACAADETAALPRRQRWTLDTPHRRAHVASLSRPLVLALLPIFRSAPHGGGHTPKNLTLFARLATHRAAGGPEATPRARRTPLPQSPRPFPVGKGGEGSRVRCGGDGGCSHRTARRLLRSWPTMISACHCRVKGRKNFPLEIFCFPP